jgi:hypothetical protein
MENQIKLLKLEITTKENNKVSLSIEEAQDLYNQLRILFEHKQEIVYPQYPMYPIYIERTIWPEYYYPVWTTNTCELNANSGLISTFIGE